MKFKFNAEEFIGRFLMHVLPGHFVRIRHYGLHHSNCRGKLQQARRLLGLPMALPVILRFKLLDWLNHVLQSETDLRLCPADHKGILVPLCEFGVITGWRAHLHSFLESFARWKFAMS